MPVAQGTARENENVIGSQHLSFFSWHRDNDIVTSNFLETAFRHEFDIARLDSLLDSLLVPGFEPGESRFSI